MLKTRLTEKYGLRYPILGAPMANHSSANLAAAVTKAGGLGSFGGISANGPDWVREQIRAVRSQTDGSFSVGFITAFIPGFEANFEAALGENVPLIILSFGDPRPYASRAQAAGVAIACQVQTLEGARWALEAGSEFIVAQGNEAGGHSGLLNTLPALSMVLGIAGETPVVAAGGIADGRSFAAVLAAGAEGAMLGTALLATPEATDVPQSSKQRIVESDGGDTVFSTVWDIVSGAPWPEGVGNRTRQDELVARWQGREEELRQQVEDVRAQLKDRPVAQVLMGQSAGFVGAVRPAAEVIASICDDAEAVLRRRVGELDL
ncbi:MAG TPA: nitronate monooxygenase [Dehalococcoidia bacterium]|nr:nitronate monooxygenase [Dehalococcoidia bacterium]